jgi:hypothetical protein
MKLLCVKGFESHDRHSAYKVVSRNAVRVFHIHVGNHSTKLGL